MPTRILGSKPISCVQVRKRSSVLSGTAGKGAEGCGTRSINGSLQVHVVALSDVYSPDKYVVILFHTYG
jgi:hypothetical protein